MEYYIAIKKNDLVAACNNMDETHRYNVEVK